MLRIGIGLRGLNKVKENLSLSLLAERLGLDFVWVPDVGLERETFVTAACIASLTKSIGIGVIANPYTRHPAVSAAAVATLSEVAGGRVRLAICAGGYKSLRPFGFRSWVKPLTSVEGAVEAIKRLFRGETISVGGEVETSGELKLAFPLDHKIPIYVAAMTGRKMMELAGRIADGVLLAGPLGLTFTKSCVDYVLEGAAKAGRDAREVTVALEALFSTSHDRNEARDEAKSLVGEMIISDPRFTPAVKAAGISELEVEKVRCAVSRGREQIAKVVSEDMVDQFSIAGSPGECVQKIRKYADIGIEEICLLPAVHSDLRRILHITGEHILPALR